MRDLALPISKPTLSSAVVHHFRLKMAHCLWVVCVGRREEAPYRPELPQFLSVVAPYVLKVRRFRQAKPRFVLCLGPNPNQKGKEVSSLWGDEDQVLHERRNESENRK